jgi:hypothetical protein
MGQTPKRRAPYDPNRPASAADQLRDPKFLKKCKTALVTKEQDRQEALDEEIRKAIEEGNDLSTFPVAAVDAMPADVIRTIVYEQLAPDVALVQIRDGHTVHINGSKTADTPLNYLHKRVRPSSRINDIQYNAALRYTMDKKALGRVGSNTASTIEHLIMSPTLSREDNLDIKEGVQFMRMAGEIKPVKDPSNQMLAAAWRAKRMDAKLDGWEIAVLNDLLVSERTVGMIADRWGIPTEAASTLVKLALWKLARVYESLDREFQAWLSIERQVTHEARG